MYSAGIQNVSQNQLYSITPSSNPNTDPHPNSSVNQGEEIDNGLREVEQALWNNRDGLVNLGFTILQALGIFE